ncbi:MAG: carboxymuconolactone decarboxylase family protein [Acidimicrobiia bacterium]|nr:carboxymuconolactone decarboxylase family protein [Acidimicrobiia bacterium]
MAWIETIPDDQWDDGLVGLVDGEPGRVDAIMAVHSLNPAGMAAHQAVYASAMRGTPTLRKVDRELVALVVSQINQCHY